MTGSGLQSIAPGPSGGPRSVQARGAKKVQGFVARFIASREEFPEFPEFPYWLLRGLQ